MNAPETSPLDFPHSPEPPHRNLPRWSFSGVERARLIVLVLLVLLSCFPVSIEVPGAPEIYSKLLNEKLYAPYPIAIFAIVTALFVRRPRLCAYLGTITAVLTWLWAGATSTTIAEVRNSGLIGRVVLMQVAGLALFILAADTRRASSLDLVARRLNLKRADVNAHWCSVTSGIQFSPTEFYASLDAALTAKNMPGVEWLRVLHRESGLLSHNREYFRILRHRHVFDVCAASFGSDFFFSCREAVIPSVVSIRAVIAVLGLLSFGLAVMVQALGFLAGCVWFVVLAAFAVWFLFNVAKLGFSRFDALLLKIPALGPTYEAIFRRDTYFQQDTRLIFLKIMDELVRKAVEDTASTKGIHLLKFHERQPILDGLYRATMVQIGPSTSNTAK